MPRGKEISDDIWKKLLTFHQSEKTIRPSQKLQLHSSSVRQIIYKWREFSTNGTLSRIRRSSKLSARNTRKIINEVKANTHITSRELQASLAATEVNVLMSTNKRKLNGHEIHLIDARNKLLLSIKNETARLNFA